MKFLSKTKAICISTLYFHAINVNEKESNGMTWTSKFRKSDLL